MSVIAQLKPFEYLSIRKSLVHLGQKGKALLKNEKEGERELVTDH